MLAFNTRADGTQDVRTLVLREGDRIEPTVQLPNVAAFRDLQLAPHASYSAVFWRRSEETLTLPRNPMFDDSLGVAFHLVLTVDALHFFILELCWRSVCIACGACFVQTFGVAEQEQLKSVWRWVLSDITVRMVGTVNNQKLEHASVLCRVAGTVRRCSWA